MDDHRREKTAGLDEEVPVLESTEFQPVSQP
jgi:hypothetical protein